MKHTMKTQIAGRQRMRLITIISFNIIITYTLSAQYSLLKEFRTDEENNLKYPDNMVSDGKALYGMSYSGGAFDLGCVFKINTNGSGFQKLLDFDDPIKGCSPQGALVIVNSTLYGMTYSGGTNSQGIIFKINTDGSGFQKLLDFDGLNKGRRPRGSLLLSGTILYGATEYGGLFDQGVIFKINTDGTGFEKLLDFDGTVKGSSPCGSLSISGDTLFGITKHGGTGNGGVVFRMVNDSNNYQKLLDLVTIDGYYPNGTLTLVNSVLYGMTAQGNDNDGIIFRINTDGTECRKLLDFKKDNTGSSPLGSLIFTDSVFYGVTAYGGDYNNGVLFMMKSDSSNYQKLFDFNKTESGSLGSILLEGNTFYGTNINGGNNGNGAAYKINIDGSGFTKILDCYSALQGMKPTEVITDGRWIYGTSNYGGAKGAGTLYKMKMDGSGYQKLLDFDYNNKGTHCIALSGSEIYGTIPAGGAFNNGTIYKINTDGTGFQELINFDGAGRGKYPSSILVSGSVIYGTTEGGGIHDTTGGESGAGVIFRLNTDGTEFRKLLDFDGVNKGRNPNSSLLLSGNTLYGTTYAGGIYDTTWTVYGGGDGVLYKINTDGTGFQKLIDFDGTQKGKVPSGNLVISGSTLYGITSGGGIYNFNINYNDGDGVIYKINTDGSDFRKLLDFGGTQKGRYPHSIAISGSVLYGVTFSGGGVDTTQRGDGVIYKIGTDGSGFQRLFDFNKVSGISPLGLMLWDQNLYGTCFYGGADNIGTVFKYRFVPLMIQTTDIRFENISSQQADILFTKGDGDYRAVFMQKGIGGSPNPADGSSYISNSIFGSGGQMGSSSWFCVYNGPDGSCTVSGLEPSTYYTVKVCEYTGNSGFEQYLQTDTTGNPASFKTGLPTGIYTTPTASVSICPNPVHDKLTLANMDRQSQISLYTLSGVQLCSVTANETSAEIDMSSYVPGIYLVRIASSGHLHAIKIIKR